jgi:hypothetical protein
MKKQLGSIVLFITVSLVISACGRWSDNIKLSTKSAIFNSNGDSIIVTTGGNWWWLTDVAVDDIRYSNFDGVDVLADSYLVELDCFIFERRDKNTIFIKLDPNLTGVKRTVIFYLEAGDYFDRITITQNSD